MGASSLIDAFNRNAVVEITDLGSPVVEVLKRLGESTRSFYAWPKNPLSKRTQEDIRQTTDGVLQTPLVAIWRRKPKNRTGLHFYELTNNSILLVGAGVSATTLLSKASSICSNGKEYDGVHAKLARMRGEMLSTIVRYSRTQNAGLFSWRGLPLYGHKAVFPALSRESDHK